MLCILPRKSYPNRRIWWYANYRCVYFIIFTHLPLVASIISENDIQILSDSQYFPHFDFDSCHHLELVKQIGKTIKEQTGFSLIEKKWLWLFNSYTSHRPSWTQTTMTQRLKHVMQSQAHNRPLARKISSPLLMLDLVHIFLSSSSGAPQTHTCSLFPSFPRYKEEDKSQQLNQETSKSC